MAKAYRDTFRPILPVGYSTMRGNQPVPPTIPLVREVANETDNEEDRNENAADKNAIDAKPILVAAQMDPDDIIAINDLIAGEIVVDLAENLEGNLSAGENEALEISTIPNDHDVNLPTEEGDALELDAAHNNLSESLAEANGTADISGQLIEPNRLICAERNNSREPSTTNDDLSNPTNKTEVKKTEIIDDDIEITYVVGQVLLPSVESTPMIPKNNDVLSGNMPYQAILDRKDVSVLKRRILLCSFLILPFL